MSVCAVLALVAVAGCSGGSGSGTGSATGGDSATTSGASAPATPTAPEAPASAPVPAAGPSFTGSWTTGYGPMVLTQTGSQVTGTYGAGGGRRVQGTVTGDRFTGQWIGPGTTCSRQVDGSDTWGGLEMTLRADGQHFDGRWSYCDRPLGGSWNGDRAAAAATPAASATPSAAATPAGVSTAPSATQQRQMAEIVVRTALQSYASGGRAGLSDAQIFSPEFIQLLEWDRTSGRARVAPADVLCMCDNPAGLTVGTVTAQMPGMDGNTGVQAVLNGPGGARTVRYRLEYVPGQGMRIYTASVGERGDRYYDGLWQIMNNARRAAG